MKKKLSVIVSTLCLAAFIIGSADSGASIAAGGNWQGCGGSPKPCYDI